MRIGLIVLVVVAVAAPVAASDSGPVATPARPASSPVFGKTSPTAQLRYNEGEALARAQAWRQAETAYTEATKLDPEFAEAWNGLGHARKMQRNYPEALAAYREALRIRPQYPQALEYLGETYVAMGKLDDARATLAQLKSLDAALADTLARAIQAGPPTTGASAAW